MQNLSLIMAVLMVFFISVVNCSSVFAEARDDLLDAACSGRGRTEKVELWFENNADKISEKGSKSLFTAKDKDGWTALMCAVADLNPQIAQLLIKAGAEINVQDNFGWTPLMYAADFEKTAMVSFLLDKEADPNVRNEDGNTALFFAVLNGNLPITRLLLANGADEKARDNNGETAADMAKRKGHDEIVKLLNSNPY